MKFVIESGPQIGKGGGGEEPILVEIHSLPGVNETPLICQENHVLL